MQKGKQVTVVILLDNETVGPYISLTIHYYSTSKGKGKVFPYSLPSVGPGADPGVQAVSPQVT